MTSLATRALLLLSAVALGATACAAPDAAPAGDAAGAGGGADVADASAVRAPAGRPLVLGSVSDDAKEEAGVFQPFADHLASRLEGTDITHGTVVVAGSVDEMAELLRNGEVDVYVDSMYGITSVVGSGDAVPVLRRWKDGSATYHSVVVVRRDSGIETLDQLAGATVAFDDPESTDGFFLPAATLLEAGVPLVPLTDGATTAGSDGVGYVFSGDDENTIFQVLEGRVDAGALSEEDLEENSGERADELVALLRTIEVPRHAVVVRTGLEPELVAAVTTALGALHLDEAGREALAEFDDTARFDTLAPESVEVFLRMSARLTDAT